METETRVSSRSKVYISYYKVGTNYKVKIIVTNLYVSLFFDDCRCPEDLALEDVIDKCLAEAFSRKKELRKHFEAYQCARSDIEILFQAEKVPGAQRK